MKQGKLSRILAALLAIVMCIGLLPIHTLAAGVEDNAATIDEPSASMDGKADLAVQPDDSSEDSEESSPVHDHTLDEAADADAEDTAPQDMDEEADSQSDARSSAGDVNGWKLQVFGQSTDLEIQDGWLTADEDGAGFTVDYGLLYQAMGGNVVVYDSAAPVYRDSILEFDVTVTGGQPGRYQVAFFPRFIDGRNCDGMAVDGAKQLQECYRVNGNEGWPGQANLLDMAFNVDETYHLKMVTVGSTFTVYADGELLTSFNGRSEIAEGTYGFRIWTQHEEKTVSITNIQRREYISSTLGRELVNMKEDDWGVQDVDIPVEFGAGDSVARIECGEETLAAGVDYTVADDIITLKSTFIAAQDKSFVLNIVFAKGSEASFALNKVETSVKEYVWTPEKGIDEWEKISGSGTFEMEEEGLRITGGLALVNTNSPVCVDGEVELTYVQKNDDGNAGILFRADAETGVWQGVWQDTGYMQRFYFKTSAGRQSNVHGDCSFAFERRGYADHKMKIRLQGGTVTLWLDDQFVSSTDVSTAETALGQMGLYTGNPCDILVKKVVFRSVRPLMLEEDTSRDITISKDGMSVRLADDFPRVKAYDLNGKSLNGTQFQYNYVTVNTVDYPAKAEVTASAADSVTYTVTPVGCDMTFDVVFSVLDGHVLEMRINNIDETNVTVNSIGFPDQPLISANSNEAGAKVDATVFQENMFTGSQWDQTTLAERHYVVSENKMSKAVSESATIVVVTNDKLSASMANNVLYNIHEFQIRAFDLPGGGISAGVWNTEFVYRGLDGEKMFPIASEPEEADLYCRVVVTEDTNDDNMLDWQDGANALKTIISGKIPGGDTAARSFFHVGYNFVSEAQQPFLKIADNMKRFSNLIDGFGQILVFKGYANEGHDSGHADYDDINKRAGGAEDMNVLTEEAEKINSLMGIHINNTEAYPEAKMFNEENMTNHNAWKWMDQSKELRREVYILNGGMDKNLDSLFEKAPGIGFVYVDTYGDDRWCSSRLADNLIGHGAMMGTENKTDLDRYVSWVHWPGINANSMHSFVYHTQKDVYNGAGTDLMWGGYGRSTSMMSWQHNWNVYNLVEQFYTNQLPQKYLMCHDVRKMTANEAIFEGGVRSTSDRKIYKDGELVVDGTGKIFIPWYAEDSVTQDPDEAAKIYHWNSEGGETTWTLPKSWQDLNTVKLYRTTQTGKVFVGDIAVSGGKVTINAEAKTPYVVYPGEAAPDITEWTTGSPIRDANFNSRDFSIWQKSGDADIQFNDDSNGVSILTISGPEAGQISQTMTGLEIGQRYRVVVWAGAANGKTARLTVEQDGNIYENYVEQTVRANDHFDTYAKGKWVDRIHVDFTATAATARIILSADACAAEDGKATFMESRILKTADPGAPTDDATCHYAVYETFEYIEEGGTGIFTPEGGGDGGYHLSETHLPYTTDTIPTGVNGEPSNWSLKMYGYGRASMRTYPATMRLLPNTEYTMEFDALGSGNVYIVSESDGSDRPLSQRVEEGHSRFTFTTGNKTD